MSENENGDRFIMWRDLPEVTEQIVGRMDEHMESYSNTLAVIRRDLADIKECERKCKEGFDKRIKNLTENVDPVVQALKKVRKWLVIAAIIIVLFTLLGAFPDLDKQAVVAAILKHFGIGG